ncbi:MAG: hypothetical protein AMXMBFR67_03910 [Nitrospira sp.]
MTTYPPFDALRTRLREARAQGRLITPPAIAKPRFHAVSETVLGPLLRHAVHILWQEGVPASVLSGLEADPPHLALRADEFGVAVYFWASTDPDQLLWALHSGDGYGETHELRYDFLSPARVVSLLEHVIPALLGLPEVHAPFAPLATGPSGATEGTGHQPVAA